MPRHLNYTFSIVVPLFNEADNAVPLLDRIFETVGDHPAFVEVVLVDDGSTDTTVEVVKDYSPGNDRIRLVQHKNNSGLGAAIRTGILHSSGDFVLYTDADLPFDFTRIPDLLLEAEESIIVKGYRLNRGEGWRRLLLTLGYNSLIRSLFGVYHTDINFACKILPRRFLETVDLRTAGSFIDAEMVLEAQRLGFEIRRVPLVYFPRERGLSTLSRPAVVAAILKEMFGYKLRLLQRNSEFITVVPSNVLTK